MLVLTVKPGETVRVGEGDQADEVTLTELRPGAVRLGFNSARERPIYRLEIAAEREHDEFVNEILRNAPDSWDDDDTPEAIAVAYVHELERRLTALGVSREREAE